MEATKKQRNDYKKEVKRKYGYTVTKLKKRITVGELKELKKFDRRDHLLRRFRRFGRR